MRLDLLAIVGTLSWIAFRHTRGITLRSGSGTWLVGLLSALASTVVSLWGIRLGGAGLSPYVTPLALALATPALWLTARGLAYSAPRALRLRPGDRSLRAWRDRALFQLSCQGWWVGYSLRALAYLCVGGGVIWQVVHRWQADGWWLPIWLSFLFLQVFNVHVARFRRRCAALDQLSFVLVRLVSQQGVALSLKAQVAEYGAFRELSRGIAFCAEAAENPRLRLELGERACRSLSYWLWFMTTALTSGLVPAGHANSWSEALALVYPPEVPDAPATGVRATLIQAHWAAFRGVAALHAGDGELAVTELRSAAHSLESPRLREYRPYNLLSIAATRHMLAYLLGSRGQVGEALDSLACARAATEESDDVAMRGSVLLTTAALRGGVGDFRGCLRTLGAYLAQPGAAPDNLETGQALLFAAVSRLMLAEHSAALADALEAARVFHLWSTTRSRRLVAGAAAQAMLRQALGLVVNILDAGLDACRDPGEQAEWADTWRAALERPPYAPIRPFLPRPDLRFAEAKERWEVEENYWIRVALLQPRIAAGDPLALLELAVLQKSVGRVTEAAATLVRVETAADQAAVPDLIWRLHLTRGELLEDEGESEQALAHYEQAISVIEQIRATIGLETWTTAFAAEPAKAELYARAVQLCIRTRAWDRAFQYVERSKSRALVDRMANWLSEVVPADSAEERALEDLRATLNLKASQTGGKGTAAGGLGPPSARLDPAVLAKYADYEAALRRLHETQPERYSLRAVEALGLSGVQGLLDPDTVMLEYFWHAGNRSFPPSLTALIISRESLQIVSLGDTLAPRQALETSINRCLPIVTARGAEVPAVAEYAKAYDLFVAPVEEHLAGFERLVVVPHGPLHRLPVHALVTDASGEEAVLDWFPRGVCYAPSATALSYCRDPRKNHRCPRSAAVLAHPTVGEGRAISLEDACVIGDVLGTEPHLDGQATRACLEEVAPRADVVHVSCHGHFDPAEPPLLAALALAGSDAKDHFTAIDAHRLRLSGTLVTLSACVSARMGVYPRGSHGEELYGLARGFLCAGTPSVVGVLWEAETTSLGRLMTHFYEALLGDEQADKAVALRTAMLAVRGEQSPNPDRDWHNPYYWGAPILIGSW